MMKRLLDQFLWLAVLALIVGFSARLAHGQTCTVRTQGWASSSGSLGRGSVDVRWISTTPAFQVREYRVYAGWALNQTPQGYFNAGTALHYSLQYVCPINGGPVTIEEIRTNGTSCSVAYGGPGGLPHGGCSGGNTSGLSTRNAASYSSFLAPDAMGAAFGDAAFTSVTASGFDSDPADGIQLPKELGGVKFLIDGEAVPLFFVSPGQINFHVPKHLSLGIHQVVAVNNDGRTFYGDIYLAKNQPGIFTADANGNGQASCYWWVFRFGIPYRIYTSGQLTRSEIQPGDRVFVIIFGTGINSPEATLQLGNGRVFSSLYAGDAPIFIGLDQLNFEIPLNDIWSGNLGASVTVFDGTGASWNGNGFTLQGVKN